MTRQTIQAVPTGAAFDFKGAGVTEPFGKYCNSAGVELEIIGYHRLAAPDILGTLYEGVIRDAIFGDQRLIVEPAAIADCGYVKIEEAPAVSE